VEAGPLLTEGVRQRALALATVTARYLLLLLSLYRRCIDSNGGDRPLWCVIAGYFSLPLAR
jgi:hypothetical protein